MLQPDVQVTLALSQFFQNDDPGLAWVHAQQTVAVRPAGEPSTVPIEPVAAGDANARPTAA